MKWIIAFLIFSLLVLFHEFGHFLVARLNGVAVEEFSLGYGPRLLSFVDVWHVEDSVPKFTEPKL